MKCPHCKKELEFETYVLYNVETYGNSVVGKAKCCGKGLRVSRRISFAISTLNEFEHRDCDDWGETLNN